MWQYFPHQANHNPITFFYDLLPPNSPVIGNFIAYGVQYLGLGRAIWINEMCRSEHRFSKTSLVEGSLFEKVILGVNLKWRPNIDNLPIGWKKIKQGIKITIQIILDLLFFNLII